MSTMENNKFLSELCLKKLIKVYNGRVTNLVHPSQPDPSTILKLKSLAGINRSIINLPCNGSALPIGASRDKSVRGPPERGGASAEVEPWGS